MEGILGVHLENAGPAVIAVDSIAGFVTSFWFGFQKTQNNWLDALGSFQR